MTVQPKLEAKPIDISPQGLAAHVDEEQAKALAATIDVQSPLSVAQFGQEIGTATARYADVLLAQARSDDLDEIGGKLSQVMVAAQSFDVTSLDNTWSRHPIVGPILACQQFGWLPCILWIAIGVVFIGAVHDVSTLVASVRHDARSVAEVVKVNLGRRAWRTEQLLKPVVSLFADRELRPLVREG